MRLLDPDVGEILDRLSILELKIRMGMHKGISTQAWEDERESLERYLQKKIDEWQKRATAISNEQFSQYNAQLVNANTALWKAEDRLRVLKKKEYNTVGVIAEEAAELAFHIADVNDARAELVRKINGLFGVETREKIYNVS